MHKAMWSALALWLCACEQKIGLQPCDIRKASCRHEVFLAVQSARGTGWDPWLDEPLMRVITKDEYRAELEASRTAAAGSPSSKDYYTPALKLLGLIDPTEQPSGETNFSVSFVAAYYDSGTRDVTVIDRGGDTDRRQDTLTLAHELVHAAQQRDLDYDTFYGWVRTLDNLNARGAMIEGEATLYENLIDVAMRDVPPLEADWKSYHDDWIRRTREQVASDPSPWRIASSGLRYPLGSRYLTQAWLQSGPLGVRRAYAARPTRSRTFMLEPGAASPGKPLTCVQPMPPDGYKLVAANVLGAIGAYAFATRVVDEPQAWMLGQQLADDRFYIFANDDDELAVLWQLQLDSADHATILDGALAEQPGPLNVQHVADGEQVSLLATTTLDPSDWPQWSQCSPQ